jgi:hypothetical protein
MEKYKSIGSLKCKSCGENLSSFNDHQSDLVNIQIDQLSEEIIHKIFKFVKIDHYRYNLFCKKCESLLAIFYKFKNEENRIIFRDENIVIENAMNFLEKNLDFLKYKNYSLQYLKKKDKEFENQLKNDLIPFAIKFNALKKKIDVINDLLSKIKLNISTILEKK